MRSFARGMELSYAILKGGLANFFCWAVGPLREGIRGRTRVEPRESTGLGIKCRFPPLQSRPFPLFPSLRSVRTDRNSSIDAPKGA